MSLRKKLIKLAYENKALRPDLLPLFKTAWDPKSSFENDTLIYLYNRTGEQWTAKTRGKDFHQKVTQFTLSRAL